MELSSPKIQEFLILSNPNLKIFPLKNCWYFFLKKNHSKQLSYIFSKQSFSYISGNGTFLHFLPKSFSYVSRNGTFWS